MRIGPQPLRRLFRHRAACGAGLILLWLVAYDMPVHLGWLLAYAGLQALRAWVLLSIGSRWTTRIIVLDEPLVRRGPFRVLRHPNYTLVVLEIAVAPMVLGLTWVALVFSALNAAVLTIRIRAENAALAPLR